MARADSQGAGMTGDRDFAERLARSTGEVLQSIREGAALGDDVKRLGDRGAQLHIAGELALFYPQDAVLSEEAPDDTARLSSSRVWIVDPLDGTREFAEGRHDWAVHIALWSHGELATGAVAIPDEGLVLTDRGLTLPPRAPGALRMAVSRTRPSDLVRRVAMALDAELIPMGSAGVKVGAVVLGTVDAYVHSGGQFEWDSAAPVAVARAAGAFTSRLDGTPLVYNRENPYLPDLVVCRPEFADIILAAIEST